MKYNRETSYMLADIFLDKELKDSVHVLSKIEIRWVCLEAKKLTLEKNPLSFLDRSSVSRVSRL